MKIYIPTLGSSIFMPMLSDLIQSIGHEVSHEEDSDWDYTLAGSERSAHTCAWVAEKQGKYYPDWKWIDKTHLNKVCKDAGLPQLKQEYIKSEKTIEDCDYNSFIIKPNVWSGARRRLPFIFKTSTQETKQEIVNLWLQAPFETLKGWKTRGFIVQETKFFEPQKSKLITIDGVVNGSGEVKLNTPHLKIMEKVKWFYERSEPEYLDNDYGLSDQIKTLISKNSVVNSMFRCQAIVDDGDNICYIIDWSWTPIRCFDFYYLPKSHFENNFDFAFDFSDTFRDQEEYLITETVEIPFKYRTSDDDLHDEYFKKLADACGVIKADILRRRPTPPEVVLYCSSGSNYTECRDKMDKFKEGIS